MVPGRMNNQQNALPGKEERKDKLRVTKSHLTQGNYNDVSTLLIWTLVCSLAILVSPPIAARTDLSGNHRKYL